jgi:hypothetical protein
MSFFTDVSGPLPSSDAKQTTKNAWIPWPLKLEPVDCPETSVKKIPTYVKSQKSKDLDLFYLSSVNISAASASNSAKLPTTPAMTDECCTPHGNRRCDGRLSWAPPHSHTTQLAEKNRNNHHHSPSVHLDTHARPCTLANWVNIKFNNPVSQASARNWHRVQVPR